MLLQAKRSNLNAVMWEADGQEARFPEARSNAGVTDADTNTTRPALAQKPVGILKIYSPDSPASMSIHEEATFVAEGPMMGVFNNLVIFDQDVKQNSPASIIPDLATGWSWNEEGTELTFPLRQGVKWHDSKPFTARDVWLDK